nr:EF-Tu/IF-2/RF-3 family GTPase [Pseudactinotalea terrae]
MTFFPDGETEIPNQTPVPGVRDGQVPPGRPTTDGPVGAARPRTDSALAKKFVRMAIINGVVLVAAVLLAYVFPVTEDPAAQTGIVVGAAILCSIHTTFVVMSHQRRRQAQGLATGSGQAPPAAPHVRGVADAQPYGAVDAAAPSAPIGGFSLTVEDVFTITGRGIVVTGRVASGRLHEGQTVVIQRGGVGQVEVKVVGIEMFRQLVQTAEAGDNVGLLLRRVTRDDVHRGDVIAA